jgi:hypothetical protein
MASQSWLYVNHESLVIVDDGPDVYEIIHFSLTRDTRGATSNSLGISDIPLMTSLSGVSYSRDEEVDLQLTLLLQADSAR